MPVWHEITPISRTNPFCQETQGQTQQKKVVLGRLDYLPFNLDTWLTGCKRGPQNDILHSLLFLTMPFLFLTMPFLFLTMPPHIPSKGHDGQRATTTNQPLSNLLFRGRLLLWSVVWEATVVSSAWHEKPKTTTSGNEATRHTHGGNLQNWDCAGAQALYDFLMRWLVHSATHAASRTHLILWAFVSLSAAGESNQHLWV